MAAGEQRKCERIGMTVTATRRAKATAVEYQMAVVRPPPDRWTK